MGRSGGPCRRRAGRRWWTGRQGGSGDGGRQPWGSATGNGGRGRQQVGASVLGFTEGSADEGSGNASVEVAGRSSGGFAGGAVASRAAGEGFRRILDFTAEPADEGDGIRPERFYGGALGRRAVRHPVVKRPAEEMAGKSLGRQGLLVEGRWGTSGVGDKAGEDGVFRQIWKSVEERWAGRRISGDDARRGGRRSAMALGKKMDLGDGGGLQSLETCGGFGGCCLHGGRKKLLAGRDRDVRWGNFLGEIEEREEE